MAPACQQAHPARPRRGPLTKPRAPAKTSSGALARAAEEAAGASPRRAPPTTLPRAVRRASGCATTVVFPPAHSATATTTAELPPAPKQIPRKQPPKPHQPRRRQELRAPLATPGAPMKTAVSRLAGRASQALPSSSNNNSSRPNRQITTHRAAQVISTAVRVDPADPVVSGAGRAKRKCSA